MEKIQTSELLTTKARLTVDVYRDETGRVYAHIHGDLIPAAPALKQGAPVPVMVVARFEKRVDAADLKTLASEIQDVINLHRETLGHVTKKMDLHDPG